jgi:AraC family transcriptional activator of mtrCDE
MICGFFSAFYGSSTDVFSSLSEPIVEQFDETDRLDGTLKLAISELIKQEVGSGAMSAAILKQVIITILRRSLTSVNLWVERFAMLSDPQRYVEHLQRWRRILDPIIQLCHLRIRHV